MTMLFAGSATSVALWIVIKASILLAATALVQVVLGRRASAATRHGIWMLCLACLIVLPRDGNRAARVADCDSRGFESAGRRVRHDAIAAGSLEDDPLSAPAIGAQSVSTLSTEEAILTPSWFAIIAGVYSIGVVGLLMFLAVQRWSLWRLADSATIRPRSGLDSNAERVCRDDERRAHRASASQPRAQRPNGLRHATPDHCHTGDRRPLG